MNQSDSRWQPTSLHIEGFVGVGAAHFDLELDRPIVVFVGNNGCGKSTILQAIEWALFGVTAVGSDGEELRGTSLDIPRMYINRGCNQALVTVRFQTDHRTLEWTRTRTAAKPRPSEDVVECRIDGHPASPDVLEQLGLTAGLYRRAIAPAQGAMQAIVSGDAAQRSSALDRLFGIEELNAVTQGLAQAKKALEAARSGLKSRVDVITATTRNEVARRFDVRVETRDAALQCGTNREGLALEAAIAEAGAIADELKVAPRPHPDDVAGLETTGGILREAADKEWSAVNLEDREKYLRGAARLATSQRGDWQAIVSERLDEALALENLIRATGDETLLCDELRGARTALDAAESDLADADRRASVLTQARHWLEVRDLESEAELGCPVCERPILPSELNATVEAALDSLTAGNGRVADLRIQRDDAAKAVEVAQDGLDAVRRQSKKVDELRVLELELANSVAAAIRRMANEGPPKADKAAAPVAKALTDLKMLVGDNVSDDVTAFLRKT